MATNTKKEAAKPYAQLIEAERDRLTKEVNLRGGGHLSDELATAVIAARGVKIMQSAG
jgi:hypothetical protein